LIAIEKRQGRAVEVIEEAVAGELGIAVIFVDRAMKIVGTARRYQLNLGSAVT
jgi:hypothetical protein